MIHKDGGNSTVVVLDENKNPLFAIDKSPPQEKVSSSEEKGNEELLSTKLQKKLFDDVTIPKHIVTGVNHENMSFNDRFHAHLAFIGTEFAKQELPKSWHKGSLEGGTHPRLIERKENIETAIQNTVFHLRTLRLAEMKAFEEGRNDDSSVDDNGSSDSEYEFDADSQSMEIEHEFISKYINESSLIYTLSTIFNENLVWDIGLQMECLRRKDKNDASRLFTSRTYCPCGKVHKSWLNQKGLTMFIKAPCHKNIFSSHQKFFQHIASKAQEGCLIHYGLWHFLQGMYRKYCKKFNAPKTIKQKSQVRDSFVLPFSKKDLDYEKIVLFQICR